MLYTFGILVVLVILFALCQLTDKVLDAERDFWIKAREVSSRSQQ
jgi:hypothetical protein